MQRLFSMFPMGRPGVALLLVRIALSVMLVEGVWRPLLRLGSPWFLLAPGVLAVALWIGFMTPVVTVLCVLLVVATFLATGGGLEAVHVCALLDAVALTLLGPGGYSIDARLFGRRQVVLPPSRGVDDDE